MKLLLILLNVCIAMSSCNKPDYGSPQTTPPDDENNESITPLTGLVGLNDASRVIKSGTNYFWYSTDGGIKMRWTNNPISGKWYTGSDVFPTRPDFWSNYSPINAAWAPDIIYDPASAEFRMYYCVSSMGSRKSAIALATNKTLDPNAPNYKWEDKGIVISTTESSTYNALDPCPILAPNGEWYLCFGSHWTGIKLMRLGADGKAHPTETTISNLARKEPVANSAIEAGAIYPGVKNGEQGYWLYVNWGTGLGHEQNATYEVRVGWSTNIRGPYLDKDGKDMYNGGGSAFTTSKQTFSADNSTRIGRGHIGIIKGHALDGVHTDWISYSYWLENPPSGESGKRFGLQRLLTGADGWPEAGEIFK
ncbi:arabinan endo-1,5-alpha-L-arabinosidase [Sphingobacterium sp. DN00404]|uniref:Arabinan endo-1,5-alpha-L-arabinosidase n=1 Tax=Sphingobacterium micropteri TaxID=2763501 RepID=A0ABR7YPX4_9SPHI|nr:arabinan endo-1,5-alpha-L-arabinosidase [Sphingobacterium micropteri]MBD1433266.1 arabinan endo-1,5-alpha-L-arabinosidase [Sphingobacterium micropteri]